MTFAGVHTLLYAVIAAASPLVLTATFVVIRSARPRTNGIAFLTGFTIGTAIACVLGLLLGQAAVARLDAHETVEDVITLGFGAFLIGIGLSARRRLGEPVVERSSRGRAVMEGLRHVGPAAAFSMAGLLGFGGPKRLVLTFLAMASISSADLGRLEDLSLAALYVVVATVLVWVPVGIVIVAGERAATILAEGESWITEHAAELRVWLSLGFGVVLAGDGMLRLVT
jgi:Sap, sulfolipid-1-addressing protein